MLLNFPKVFAYLYVPRLIADDRQGFLEIELSEDVLFFQVQYPPVRIEERRVLGLHLYGPLAHLLGAVEVALVGSEEERVVIEDECIVGIVFQDGFVDWNEVLGFGLGLTDGNLVPHEGCIARWSEDAVDGVHGLRSGLVVAQGHRYLQQTVPRIGIVIVVAGSLFGYAEGLVPVLGFDEVIQVMTIELFRRACIRARKKRGGYVFLLEGIIDDTQVLERLAVLGEDGVAERKQVVRAVILTAVHGLPCGIEVVVKLCLPFRLSARCTMHNAQ